MEVTVGPTKGDHGRRQQVAVADRMNHPGGATVKISIGIITRERPKLLTRLLDSLLKLSLDAKFSIVFIVVENNHQKTLEAELSRFQTAAPSASVIYELEPRIGIPCARNRAVDIAIRSGCNLHAFVDDDEQVDPNWLENLTRSLDSRQLDLVGGPMRLGTCPDTASRWERVIWNSLVHRQSRIERSAKKKWTAKRDGNVMLATNNWLINLEWLRKAKLRFDESLRLSGGSDALFFRQAKLLGIRSGWAPDAITHEHIPETRLSVAYQFCRGRDQMICSYRAKYSRTSFRLLLRSLLFVTYKSLTAGFLLCFSALNRGRSLVRSIRLLGGVAGRVAAIFGGRSRHYEIVHGD